MSARVPLALLLTLALAGGGAACLQPVAGVDDTGDPDGGEPTSDGGLPGGGTADGGDGGQPVDRGHDFARPAHPAVGALSGIAPMGGGRLLAAGANQLVHFDGGTWGVLPVSGYQPELPAAVATTPLGRVAVTNQPVSGCGSGCGRWSDFATWNFPNALQVGRADHVCSGADETLWAVGRDSQNRGYLARFPPGSTTADLHVLVTATYQLRCAVAPDGAVLVAAGNRMFRHAEGLLTEETVDPGAIPLATWQQFSFEALAAVPGHAAASGSGGRVFARGEDGTWRLALELGGGTGPLRALALCPDGRGLAFSATGNTTRHARRFAGQWTARDEGPEDAVLGVTCVGEDRYVAVGYTPLSGTSTPGVIFHVVPR